MRCFLRIVCTILVVFMYDTTENVWADVYKDVADLLAPTPKQLSQMGPKSHPLDISQVGVPPVKPVLKRSSPGYMPNNVSVRAEGCSHELPWLRESAFSADENQKHIQLPQSIPQRPLPRKKSWLRVVRRALEFGRARFRGRWLHVRHISAQDIEHVRRHVTIRRPAKNKPTPSQCPSPVGGRVHKCLSLLSWNCGGLTTTRYDELLQHASEAGLDVLALQETRRRSSQTWQSGIFTIFQSGDELPGSYSGILLAVRHVETSRVDHAIPGRVLHVQLVLAGASATLDLVVVYQKFLPLEADEHTTAETLKVRQSIWHALDAVLARIPRRHAVFLLGDLNTHLAKAPPQVVSDDPSKLLSPDADTLLALLVRHDMVPLHRFQGAQAATHRTPHSSGTRIDYLYCRANMSPCCSGAAIQWGLPFMHMNAFGAHGALTGSFRTSWACWRSRRRNTSRSPSYDRTLAREALSVQHPKHVEFQESLRTKLAELPLTLDNVGKVIYDVSTAMFCRPRMSRTPPPWTNIALQRICQQKWASFRRIRSLAASMGKLLAFKLNCSNTSSTSLRLLFQHWHACSQLSKHSKMHKQLGCKLRRAWLEQVFEDASASADKRDPAFFQHVRRLSPKCSRPPHGHLPLLQGARDLAQELDLFEGYFSDLFNAYSGQNILEAHSWSWMETPLNCSMLDPFFQRIPLFKGVPREHPVGAIWRMALQNPLVRGCLDAVLEDLPHSGVPSRFTDGSLILLHKPGKSGREVSHYRPLVLQCPVGKAILKWASSQIRSVMLPKLLLHPQFAFLPNRSAEMAIFKAQSFLAHRRQVAGYVIPPSSWIKAGWTRPSCSGCLVVSLDLSQAFDRVDRSYLMHCLASHGIASDILGLIWSWHLYPEYHLQLGDSKRDIRTSRGVRQGCTIAPLLWTVFLYDVIEDLCRKYPEVDWLSLLVESADDLLLCFGMDFPLDLEKAIKNVCIFLDHLEYMGLCVNLDKTQFLLHISGTQASKILKKHTCIHKGTRCLRLSPSRSPKICQSVDYLGIKLSWQKSSELSLAHRMNSGRRSFAILYPWWRSTLSLALKVRLYTTIVLPTVTYGLSALGLSDSCCKKLHSFVMKQIRSILRSPSHITRESDMDLLKRLHVVPVFDKVSLGACRLLRRMTSTLRSQASSCTSLTSMLHHHSKHQSQWWQTLLRGLARLSFSFSPGYGSQDVCAFLSLIPEEMLHEAWLLARPSVLFPPQMPMLLESFSEFVCPDCNRRFPSFNQLRSHQRHGISCKFEKRQLDYNPCLDARSATPSCFWCKRSFKWWHQVQVHIQQGQCSALDRRDEVLQAQPRPAMHLHADLKEHCIMCGRWFKFARSLSKHLRSSHGSDVAAGMTKYREIDLSALKAGRQCPFCLLLGSSSQISGHLRGHCVVLLQRCMAQSTKPQSPDWRRYIPSEVVPSCDRVEQDSTEVSPPCQHPSPSHAAGTAVVQTSRPTTSRCLGSTSRTPLKAGKVSRRLRTKQRDPRASAAEASQQQQQQQQQQTPHQSPPPRFRQRTKGRPGQVSCQIGAAAARSDTSAQQIMRVCSPSGSGPRPEHCAATHIYHQSLERRAGEVTGGCEGISASPTLQAHHGQSGGESGGTGETRWGRTCQEDLSSSRVLVPFVLSPVPPPPFLPPPPSCSCSLGVSYIGLGPIALIPWLSAVLLGEALN